MIPMAIRKISLVLIRSWTDCESSRNATKGKVLFDECIDSRLADHIHAVGGHYRRRSRMRGITNGKLLALAQAEFDVFITLDRNLSLQQRLPKFDIAVILLAARTNRVNDLAVLLPELLKAIPMAPKGAVTIVGL